MNISFGSLYCPSQIALFQHSESGLSVQSSGDRAFITCHDQSSFRCFMVACVSWCYTTFEDELFLEEARSFQGLGSIPLARLMNMWPAWNLSLNLNSRAKECTSTIFRKILHVNGSPFQVTLEFRLFG